MIVQVNFLQKLLNNYLQLHILSFIHVYKAQKKMANETNHSNCQLFSTAISFFRCKGKGKSFIIIMKKKNKRRSVKETKS